MPRLETEPPYSADMRKRIELAQRYDRDLLFVAGSGWWVIAKGAVASMKGTRFRVEGNRLHLIPPDT